MQMMLLLSSRQCHDPCVPYSSNLPHAHCICLGPARGAHSSVSPWIYSSADPLLQRFSPRGQAHNDAASFRDASVPEKYLPSSSSPPFIKHLLKKSLFSTSAAFLPSNIWLKFFPLKPTAANAHGNVNN